MNPDPVVEGVRAVRNKHAKKFHYNLAEICADLKEKEKASSHDIISRFPKVRKQKTGS